ncbi:hypothetical protein ALO_13199 [Acetonema longum DSM 6540]|uniref:Uncharacterized protein n=1 Tax=Acetonema longum DSM 6540 TaxID=1009370 RepID=F7NKM1_9FIRM|nr:hypothetical protein ALO_13199 [Acetonema longum DSM 6540]
MHTLKGIGTADYLYLGAETEVSKWNLHFIVIIIFQ